MVDVINLVAVSDIPKAQPTPTDDLMALFRLAAKMEKICDSEKGVGLSAVQVGVPYKFFILKRGRSYEYYVDCEYVGIGDKQKSIEGCLSIRKPDGGFRRYEVDRYAAIQLKGKQLKVTNTPSVVLEEITLLETGLPAIIFQHEIDHGHDILISEIGREIELIA